MACCLCFFKASKKTYWPRLALLFAATLFSSAAFHIGVVLVLIIMFLSTLFLFTFSKQKPIILDRSLLLKENDTTRDQETEIDSEENEQGLLLIGSSEDDLYSSESQSKPTTTSTNNNNTSSCEDKDEDKHSSSSSSSDQWPYYINSIKGQKKIEYCSDDEESLIEIAIPSEHFVISNPDLVQKRDYNINYDQQHTIKCCKLSATTKEDLLAASDMINEEDSFIEIDIYMGSIKYCSAFS